MTSVGRPAIATLLVWVVVGAAASPAVAQTAPLRVTRTAPAESAEANPLSQITVTFDRPVAGSLDRTVDPATVLRIEPAIRGRLEWRDPVTVRLIPEAPLAPGASYTATVSNTFRSMDGGALAQPYRFSFRVRGPTLIGGFPLAGQPGQHVALNQHFSLVYSDSVDLATLSAAAHLEFSSACSGQRIVHLRAASERRIDASDRGQIKEAGGPRRDRALDSLRRVVELVLETALPRGCDGELVTPQEVDPAAKSAPKRLAFATHGDMRIVGSACTTSEWCPRGPITLTFSTPVTGAEVLRHVHISPEVTFAIGDTVDAAPSWVLDCKLEPRRMYTVFADSGIRDMDGQSLHGNPTAALRTTGFRPSINYANGYLVVERSGLRSLSVQHVNVDTLVVVIAPVLDSMEARVASRPGWAMASVWAALMGRATTQRIPVHSSVDRVVMTNVRLPVSNTLQPGAPTLYAVKISGRVAGQSTSIDGPVAVVQMTNLGVHAKIGPADGAVWVTGVNDGLPRAGATVVVHDAAGRVRATAKTDARGLARLTRWNDLPAAPAPSGPAAGDYYFVTEMDRYVKVTLGDDRAIANVNSYSGFVMPSQFGMFPAWNDTRIPVAGALFTERGIYRPGERVFAKAIVRDGALGALRAPQRGDSIKWRFRDHQGKVVRESTVRLTAFGTSSQTFDIPPGAAVGRYGLSVMVQRQHAWREVGAASYRVADYRQPEFLVHMSADKTERFPADQFAPVVQARYLFGATMGRAAVTWTAQERALSPWELRVPGMDGWFIGDGGAWWEDEARDQTRFLGEGSDTLDVKGERAISVRLPEPLNGRASMVTVSAAVADVNRQVVGASASTIVHPAAFYIAARPVRKEYFWKVGTPQVVEVVAVRPTGEKVSDVRVRGTVVRREWHRVRRERNGVSEVVGDWVSDTVGTCNVTTAAAMQNCTVTPTKGGIYVLTFHATDAAGRSVSTSMQRWTLEKNWVEGDETQFKMDVVPDKSRYSVGDTATILFAAPFTNAEAWVTVEREGLIDERRLRITSGSTTLKLPITEAYAPNVFVSIVVARGRSAPPGPVDDPGRPTIRVGYAALHVTPEVKRLTVSLSADKREYRPRDSVHVHLRVRDHEGHGPRSEVALWAVDEGVLALTDYRTPDPLDLLYRDRGVGVWFASNLTAVAPQVPEGEKGEPSGAGDEESAMSAAAAPAAQFRIAPQLTLPVLRSRFQTTAFFLATVVTDDQGNAVASAKLPDNLTTFRVMAVAVTAGDRYGKGESELLVTRPLLARQALPRFVRPGDDFVAGAVINRRDGAAVPVTVRAQAHGVTLAGDSLTTVTLAPQRGVEVRFPFRAVRGDSASFRFDVTSGRAGDADAVRVSLPIRPEYYPRAHTVAATMRDSARVDIELPADIDPDRSTVSINLGTSPLATIKGMTQALRVYPYDCTEQVVSAATPIIALYRAQRQMRTPLLGAGARAEIERAVAIIRHRQRDDGGIGYWSPTDWSTAWLSAYAGTVLLDARDAGITVDSLLLDRLARYVGAELHGESSARNTPVWGWYTARWWRLRDQVAAVDFLSRDGRPDVASENELLRNAAQLTLEDRARLAQVLARRRQSAPAHELLASVLASVHVEGRRAVIGDTMPRFYFESTIRPYARLLLATLAIDPENAVVGPLVESLATIGRIGTADRNWDTQDYAFAVAALAAVDQRQRARTPRVVRVSSGGRRLMQAAKVGDDSTLALTGLLADAPGGKSLHLDLDATTGDALVFYYVTVSEVPRTAPVTPQDAGIRVERWYERYDTGAPVTSAAEGDVVRVRLRVSVPSLRQFLVLDDALPAGLEAVDLSLRTASANPGPGVKPSDEEADHAEEDRQGRQSDAMWNYGYWDSGWWSPFDHRELRDERVLYSATVLWPGTYTATYLARATTAGTFIKPPAHAEEMYNPGVNGRSDGGTFVVTHRRP